MGAMDGFLSRRQLTICSAVQPPGVKLVCCSGSSSPVMVLRRFQIRSGLTSTRLVVLYFWHHIIAIGILLDMFAFPDSLA